MFENSARPPFCETIRILISNIVHTALVSEDTKGGRPGDWMELKPDVMGGSSVRVRRSSEGAM